MTEKQKQAVNKIANYLESLAYQSDYETIMEKAQNDKRFQKMVQDMTVCRMLGGSSLAKYGNRFNR